jgi:phage-related protein
MAVPVSDLQQIAPSAIIELFQLELNASQHGVNETYYFHAGVNADDAMVISYGTGKSISAIQLKQ